MKKNIYKANLKELLDLVELNVINLVQDYRVSLLPFGIKIILSSKYYILMLKLMYTQQKNDCVDNLISYSNNYKYLIIITMTKEHLKSQR